MRYVLSIDPGLNGTGVVFWVNGKPLHAQVLRPLVKSSSDDENLTARARNVADRIQAWLASSNDVVEVPSFLTVVIEFPEFQEGFRGATARRTGSIDKLAFLIGVMVGDFPRHWDVHTPRVRDWKGQLPKDVVIRRMTKHYGRRQCEAMGVRTHAWDALGIGHWFIHQREK